MVEPMVQPFPREEFEQRLARVREEMARRRVDTLVVDQTEHLAYLAGYAPSTSRYQALLVPLEAEPVAIVRTVDEQRFVEESWLDRRVAYADWEEPIAVLCATVERNGWSRGAIGIETDSHNLTVDRYEAMKDALPDATFVGFSRVLWELRLRKSPREVAYLRRAAEIADAAMRAAVAAAHEGKTERDVAAVAYAACLSLGSDNVAVGPIMSGSRLGGLHGSLGSRRLQRGDILHMEMVPRVRGYTAKIMRPTSIGEPTAARRDAAARLIEIQDEQMEAMKPGVAAAAVDRVCREQLLGSGLRDTLTTSTGYTVGFVAPPLLSDLSRCFLPQADWPLEEGMVFHVYVSAQGLGFSETVLVTDSGHERLTLLERVVFVR